MRLKLKCWYIRNFYSDVVWCNPDLEPFKSLPLWAEWLPDLKGKSIWRKVGYDKVYYYKRK